MFSVDNDEILDFLTADEFNALDWYCTGDLTAVAEVVMGNANFIIDRQESDDDEPFLLRYFFFRKMR
jgi:hypothetical protein